MRIGYARVSTHEQNLDLQKDALKKAGCEKVVVDVASGKKTQRSGLDRVRELFEKGGRAGRLAAGSLGRWLKHLIELMTDLEHAGIGFQSLQEHIDTTSPGGKLVFHIFGHSPNSSETSSRSGPRRGSKQHGPGAARAGGRRASMPSSVRWPSTSTHSESTPSRRSAGRWASPSRHSTPTCVGHRHRRSLDGR